MTTSSNSAEINTVVSTQSLPYAFAKRHGVLIGQIDTDKVQVLFRDEINPQTLTEVRRIVGRPIQLSETSDEQFDATLDYLTKLDFDRLGVSHCTGQLRSAQLHASFPSKVFFANVGTTVLVE